MLPSRPSQSSLGEMSVPRASKAAKTSSPRAKKQGKKATAGKAAGARTPAKKSTIATAPKKAASAAGPKRARSAAKSSAKPARAASKPARSPQAGGGARPASLDKFLTEQKASLEAERESYVAQADTLKAEADQMAQEAEPGDVQFDEESGEGGTMNIDRERDLALSAQARAAVEDIDLALGKIAAGTYGTCERCGQPIPKARLKALPQARLCVACKSGGLSRR